MSIDRLPHYGTDCPVCGRTRSEYQCEVTSAYSTALSYLAMHISRHHKPLMRYVQQGPGFFLHCLCGESWPWRPHTRSHLRSAGKHLATCDLEEHLTLYLLAR